MTITSDLDLVVAAKGNWRKFEPGIPDTSMNENLKLLVDACRKTNRFSKYSIA